MIDPRDTAARAAIRFACQLLHLSLFMAVLIFGVTVAIAGVAP